MRYPTRMRIALITISLLALPIGYLVVCLRPPQVIPVSTDLATSPLIIIQGKTMGSTYRVQYWVASSRTPQTRPGEAEATSPTQVTVGEQNVSAPSPARVQAVIEQELARIDDEISTWKADSVLSRFNAYRGSDWFEVTPGIVDMVQSSGELTMQSAGRYDVTVGPLVAAWGFGPSGRVTQLPAQSDIDKLLESVGWRHVQVRTQPPALRKLKPELQIDLSSLGAGEAADRLANHLRQMGLENFFIDVTGEIITAGRRMDGGYWNVGIANPQSTERSTIATVSMSDMSIATSGNYRNKAEVNGQSIVHTIDAKTGRPVVNDTLSVSVIDRSCRRADALATMLMTMDSDTAMQLAKDRGWNIILVRPRPETIEPGGLKNNDLNILWSDGAARYNTSRRGTTP